MKKFHCTLPTLLQQANRPSTIFTAYFAAVLYVKRTHANLQLSRTRVEGENASTHGSRGCIRQRKGDETVELQVCPGVDVFAKLVGTQKSTHFPSSPRPNVPSYSSQLMHHPPLSAFTPRSPSNHSFFSLFLSLFFVGSFAYPPV